FIPRLKSFCCSSYRPFHNRNRHLSYDSVGKALLCPAPLKKGTTLLMHTHDS
ncbi:unnamed protein product, partial (mitochondrion) [Musa textilis]